MRILAMIGTLMIATCSYGAGSDEASLASQFYDATIRKQIDLLIQSATDQILTADPTKAGETEIYRQWAKEAYGSEEYKNVYVNYFIEEFTL